MFTLNRKIDIHYNTNRWILIIAALVSVLGIFISGDLLTGLKIGLAVFLTWAMSREIDPKREYAAFASVVFSLYSLFVVFKVDLLLVFFILLATRLVNHISGKKPTLLDLASLIGLAVFLSFNSKNIVFIFLLVLAIVLSDKFKEKKALNIALIVVSIASLSYIVFEFVSNGFRYDISSYPLAFLSLLLVSYFLFIFLDKNKSTINDKNNQADSDKILKGQVFFGISVVALILFSEISIGNIIIYASSIVGVILYGLFDRLIRR